jgi:hypothetical protein
MIRWLFLFSTFLFFRAQAQEFDFLEDSFLGIPGDAIVEKKIFELVNLERKKNGLSQLTYDTHLRSAARQHSQDMLKRNYFSHFAPTEELKNPGDRVYQTGLCDFVVGENIAVHSLEGLPEQIAEKLMDQWMTSAGHRANILRPEFTDIGIGVVSAKDSTITDTLIRGHHARRTTYSIRHYGTQVFVQRSLLFSNLSISKRSTDFTVFDLLLQSDRGMLAVFNNVTQFFEPQGNNLAIHVEYPGSDSLFVNLAYVENAYTQEYINFFKSAVAIQHIMEPLNQIKFPIISRDITIVRKEKYFLHGEAEIVQKDEATQCFLYVDSDRYYALPVVQHRIVFNVPVESKAVRKISFALGGGKQKTVRNQLTLDVTDKSKAETSRSIFKKFIP